MVFQSQKILQDTEIFSFTVAQQIFKEKGEVSFLLFYNFRISLGAEETYFLEVG